MIKRERFVIMGRKYTAFLCLAILVSLSAAAGQAQATLGGSADSVEADRDALSAGRRVMTARNGYTVQEINTDSVSVREYVSPSGVVFGIAWNGLIHPDLMELLGSYAGEYEKALEQTPRKRGRRRLQVKTSNVVVEKWGHMRNLQGRAYAPALIPSGMSVDEIR
ncbi:MAG: DUF2844 domain-containing protein [Nitrospirae bacterium]|nr:DUF2844 domain-containing protein [Nitrospirota bacterium]